MLQSIAFVYIPKDCAHLSSGTKRNGCRGVELRVVPLHLGQQQDFSQQVSPRRSDSIISDLQRARYIHSWILLVEVHAAARIQKILRVSRLKNSSARRRIVALPI